MAQPRQQAPEYRVSVQSPDSAYGPQLLEPQHGPYHVTASRSRRSHYSVPSPNSSMISSNPVPLTRPFDSTSFSQPGYLPSELPVDPRLDELSFGSQSGRASPSFNPNVEPWGPHNLRNNFVQLLSPHVAYNRYPNGPGSAGKHSAPRSDSGYQSQSAISNEYGVYNADSQQTVMSRVNSQHRNSVTLVQAPLQPPIPLDQRSQVSSRDEPHDKSLVCSICGNSCKCKSDYKKHMLRHEKPFICEVPGCKRDRKGFTTQNDLDRHKKSVHSVNRFEKSYKCASFSCKNKEKVWPRLDNFKQHIERMHKTEDQIELISLSSYRPESVPLAQQNDSINPRQLDRELNGMGSTFSSETGNFPGSLWPPNISQAELSTEAQALPMTYAQVMSYGSSSSPGLQLNNTGCSNGTNFGSLPPRTQQTRPRPRTSSAPQTKAQQTEATKQRKALEKLSGAIAPTEATKQRQALEKLSGAIATQGIDSPSQVFDLEDALRRILSDQNNDSGLTKQDALKALQAMSSLIKNTPNVSYQQPRRNAHHGFSADAKVCGECGHAVARDCDLRKHMKRHEKPFGCTYPKCYKRFGAKSDWKRHENSQHFQLEAYRCRDCGEHFLRVEKFETHLTSKHGVTDRSKLDAEIKARKIGKNCQTQFWCGFCKDVIPLRQRRNAAWDERFDHIAGHFQEMKIDEWVCAEENKRKGEVRKENDRNVFDDDERSGAASDEADEMPGTASTAPPAPAPPPQFTGHIARDSASRKRKEPPEPSSPEQHTRHHRRRMNPDATSHIVYFCCHCGNGPCGPTQVSCVECSHAWDTCCRTEFSQD